MSLKLNSLKAGDLDQYAAAAPEDFCDTGLTTRDQNHCAHFVCHALDFNMRTPLCGDLKYSTRHKGVTMRVNDIFNYCTVRGYIDDAATVPQAVSGFSAFLVVATIPDNVIGSGDTITIGDNPHKHIGIHLSGKVWNLSNGKFMVVSDTLDEFFKKMKQAYGNGTKFLKRYQVFIRLSARYLAAWRGAGARNL